MKKERKEENPFPPSFPTPLSFMVVHYVDFYVQFYHTFIPVYFLLLQRFTIYIFSESALSMIKVKSLEIREIYRIIYMLMNMYIY